MTPYFNICTDGNELIITGESDKNNEYVSSYIPPLKGKYKYEDCATINLIYLITSSRKEELIHWEIVDHSCSDLDEIHYALPQDGYYQVHHIILPNTNILSLRNAMSILGDVDKVYYIDGDKVYVKRLDNDEISEVKDLGTLLQNEEGTTINRSSKKMFSYFNLKTCFIKYCKNFFNSVTSKCSPKIDTFERDFIWMTINVIKYYLDLGDAISALRILEDINYCNGFCNNVKSIQKNSTGCGCSKA